MNVWVSAVLFFGLLLEAVWGLWFGYQWGVRSERKRQAARDAAVVAKGLATKARKKAGQFYVDPNGKHVIDTNMGANHVPFPSDLATIKFSLEAPDGERTEARP